MSASDLADKVKGYAESTGTEISEIDVCYVAYDHILQMARNEIGRVLSFDICNDMKGDAEIYVRGNAMGTSYGYSSEAIERLTNILEKSSKEQFEELLESQLVKVFLEDVNIDIDGIWKSEK